MSLTEIINKIKEYYLLYLTKEEIDQLNTNPNEQYIRNLVNKIWKEFLTSPFAYEEGKPFRFLVNKNNIFCIEYIPFKDLSIFSNTSHELEILTEENIIDECTGRVGFIVDVDWQQTNKILLPIDLKEQGIYIRTTPKPLAMFNVSIGEGKVSGEYAEVESLANDNNILFVDFNKRKYNQSYKLTIGDKYHITSSIIVLFMFEMQVGINPFDFKLRDSLIKKYNDYILKRFNNLITLKNYEDQIFINEMLEYLKNKENIIKRTL